MSDEEMTPECKTVLEIILYKMDRTLAILGIVAIAVFCMISKSQVNDSSVQISMAAITGLATFIGARSGK